MSFLMVVMLVTLLLFPMLAVVLALEHIRESRRGSSRPSQSTHSVPV